jgi:hypothetical protein
MLVCDLYLLNLAILIVSGLSGVLKTLERILLSYPVHMHSHLRSLRQEQVHVGPITWDVLPQFATLILSKLFLIFSHLLLLYSDYSYLFTSKDKSGFHTLKSCD